MLNNADLNISTLDLSENSLDDKNAALLCNGLYKMGSLQILNLAGNDFSNRGLF